MNAPDQWESDSTTVQMDRGRREEKRGGNHFISMAEVLKNRCKNIATKTQRGNSEHRRPDQQQSGDQNKVTAPSMQDVPCLVSKKPDTNNYPHQEWRLRPVFPALRRLRQRVD